MHHARGARDRPLPRRAHIDRGVRRRQARGELHEHRRVHGAEGVVERGLGEEVVEEVPVVAREGEGEVGEEAAEVAAAGADVVAFEGGGAGVGEGEDVAVVGPEVGDGFAGCVGGVCGGRGGEGGGELLGEDVLRDGGLDDVGAVQAVHAVCADGAALERGMGGPVDVGEEGREGADEDGDVLEGHAPADVVEVEAFEGKGAVVEEGGGVEVVDVGLVGGADGGFGAVVVDEGHSLDGAVGVGEGSEVGLQGGLVGFFGAVKGGWGLECVGGLAVEEGYGASDLGKGVDHLVVPVGRGQDLLGFDKIGDVAFAVYASSHVPESSSFDRAPRY